MKLREGYFIGAIGALAFVLLTVWSLPLVQPLAWGDLCVAAGLRPPVDAFNGFCRAILSLLYASLPAAFVLPVAEMLAHAVVAGAVAGVYVVFRDFLPHVMNADVHCMRIARPLYRGIAAMTALLFLCIDPVWRAGQCLTSVTVSVALVVFAAVCLMRFLQGGGAGSLYLCFLGLGAFSSDCLAGVPLSIAAMVWLKVSVKNNATLSGLSDDLIWGILFKRLVGTWLLAWGAGIGVGIMMFVRSGGLTAVEGTGVVSFSLNYLVSVVRAVLPAAGFAGWFYGLFVCICPFVLACAMLRRASGKDKPLTSGVETIFALIVFSSLLQIGAMTPLMSWCRVKLLTLVPSESLLVIFQTFTLASLAIAASVFGFDICCRNYRRIINWQLMESNDGQLPLGVARSLVGERGFRRGVFSSVLVLLPVLVLFGRCQGQDREMARLIMRYVSEVVAECRGRSVVFTDGAFDPLIELCAQAEGERLVAVSTLSQNKPYERTVRARAVETDEDAALLANDGITALRTWIESGNSNRLSRCAAMVGWEFWKRKKGELPAVSGVVIVPGEPSAERIGQGRAAADKLAEDVLALCRQGVPSKADDVSLRRMFPFVQWRLAQVSRYRAYADALAWRYDESVRSTDVAEKLDVANPCLTELNKRTFMSKIQNGGVLTPREALVIGLSRADFRLAAYFAQPILKTDPDDARANFAMGMQHYLAEEWAMSEQYFRRCLKRAPNDPAVLNNLANVQARLGMFAEAEANVGKALERMPNSPEILKAQSQIKELAGKAKKVK